MAKVTQEVCDVCAADGNPSTRRQVKPYRVGQDGLLVRVLLCRQHRKNCDIDRLIELGSIVPTPSPRVRVWGWEEVQARKQALEKRKAAPNP